LHLPNGYEGIEALDPSDADVPEAKRVFILIECRAPKAN